MTRLEVKTLQKMILIYCRKVHGKEKNVLCSDCQNLLDYAKQRVEKCIYGDKKPVCSKCDTHCYKPEMRTHIKKVMQFSGPKMLFAHPFLAIRHLYRSKFIAYGRNKYKCSP